jgi:hypothetical protein
MISLVIAQEYFKLISKEILMINRNTVYACRIGSIMFIIYKLLLSYCNSTKKKKKVVVIMPIEHQQTNKKITLLSGSFRPELSSR